MNGWTYVITTDRGGAPNFEPPATTLTLCKPQIRKFAKKGELVLAFNGKKLNPTEPHSVRWASVVSDVIPLNDYWNDLRFEGKRPGRPRGLEELPDNIYRPTAGGLERVQNETHTLADMARDVGGVNALVFKRHWCFGQSVAILPEHFDLRMTKGRGGHHRFEISESTWQELKQWLDKNVPEARHARTSDDGHCCR